MLCYVTLRLNEGLVIEETGKVAKDKGGLGIE